jgi:hypothetical protein
MFGSQTHFVDLFSGREQHDSYAHDFIGQPPATAWIRT